MMPEQPPLPPKTTAQEDITLAGQRRINIIWEVTQAIIALFVIGANMGMAIWGKPVPESITNALFLIVGFYFSRTNHAAIGGTGAKRESPYMGR